MRSIDRKRLIQRYYSARVKDYDSQKEGTWKASGGFGDEVVCAMLQGLRGLNGALVLEVGVGSGRNALPMLKKVRPQFVGIDLSKEMLERAKTKLHSFKGSYDLVLGDAEHLPFVAGAFDGLVCMSTMHYFDRQDLVIRTFHKILKERGIFAYGDLTVHELDNEGFFEGLERTVSKAHAGYYKPSEIKGILETCGFTKSRTAPCAYRKSYRSLMEDKGEYFDVPAETLNKHVQSASANAKARYGLTDTELTLYYTVITAQKQNRDQRFDASTSGLP